MKRFICILLCALIAFAVVGCKSEKEKPPQSNAPKTTIDPSSIDWGYDSESDKSDRWYLKSCDDVVYIYFTPTDDNSVCTYNIVRSGVVKQTIPCVVSADNHLVPEVPSKYDLDLVFEDSFNCYSYTTDEWYSRGDLAEYNARFGNLTFTEESDSTDTLTLNADGTLSYKTGDKTTQGNWTLISTKKLECTIGETTVLYAVTYNDDSSVKAIESDSTKYYCDTPQDSTINKYKAY